MKDKTNKLIRKFKNKKDFVYIVDDHDDYYDLYVMFNFNHNGESFYIVINYIITNLGITGSISFNNKNSDQFYNGDNINKAYSHAINKIWINLGSEKTYFKNEKNKN